MQRSLRTSRNIQAKNFSSVVVCLRFFPHCLSLYVFSVCFKWEFFSPWNYIKLNITIISLKLSFQLSPHAALGNIEEGRCYDTFHTFELSLAPLNLNKHVNTSDFNDSEQEFIKIEAWLLLTFFLWLYSQLTSMNSIVIY